MGFLTLDHRACDPAIQRQYGGLREFDTRHCQHCEHVLIKTKDKTKPQTKAMCFSCGPICPPSTECYRSFVALGCVKGSLNFRRAFDASMQRQQLFAAAGI